MSSERPNLTLRAAGPRRRRIGLAVMIALAALWLAAASRVHVNASWSDEAWGYAAFPLFGTAPEIGDRVLFEPPASLDSPVPYLKTVRGVPGMTVTMGSDRTVLLDGVPVGRAKAHALDGRPLAAIAPGVIPPGHYYLFADHADSHDSRYAEIGLVPRSRILGRAIAIPGEVEAGALGERVETKTDMTMKGTAREARQAVTKDEAAEGRAGVTAERSRSFEEHATENLPVVGDWLAGKLFGTAKNAVPDAAPGGTAERPRADERGWGDSSP